MNYFIKKYHKIIIPFIIVFIICRISMAYGVIIGESNLNGFNITSLQIIDIGLAIFIVYTLYIVMDVSFKQKNRKSKRFKLLAIVIIFVGILFEFIVSDFYHFPSSISGCEYSELCNLKSLLYYQNDNITIFTDNNSIIYYQKKNKGWKVDNTRHNPLYTFNDHRITIKIYEIYEDYFVYVTLKDNNSIEMLDDNTDYKFSLLSIANSPMYFANNRYGKILNSLENYRIYLNNQEIKYK